MMNITRNMNAAMMLTIWIILKWFIVLFRTEQEQRILSFVMQNRMDVVKIVKKNVNVSVIYFRRFSNFIPFSIVLFFLTDFVRFSILNLRYLP